MKFSDSNSFYDTQKNYNARSDVPMFWRGAILKTVQPANFGGDQNKQLQVIVTVQLSNLPPTTKWVEISYQEYQKIQETILQNSPQARMERARDARDRGDASTDMNPSGGENNCGYCVIAWMLGQKNAEKAKQQADFMEVCHHPDWTDTDQVYTWVSKHTSTGPRQEFQSKADLSTRIQNDLQQNHKTQEFYIMWIPNHLMIIDATLNPPKILIRDEQTQDLFDLALMPEGFGGFFSAQHV